MDYSRPSLIDALASSYVLGTLHGGARRRFETLLSAHPALRSAVHDWQARLAPLSQSLAPTAPPKRVWQGIENRLFTPKHASSAQTTGSGVLARLWNNVRLWQATTAAGVVWLASSLLMLTSPSPAPMVVMLQASSGAQQFVVSVNRDGRSLMLTPIAPSAHTPTGKSLQLWALTAAGKPHSLGVLVDKQAIRLDSQQGKFLTAAATAGIALAVSVEPLHGSPTGLPTGEVIASGKLY